MANTMFLLLGKFCQRIIKDFQYKQLLPLKLLFFVHASTIFVLYPYLTIHMRELGISVEETAIMSAVTPVVAIIMPPLAGMIADRIGNFKILLSIFSALGGGSALLLLLVPVGRITVTYPERLVMDLSCSADMFGEVLGPLPDRLQFNLVENEPCDQIANKSTSQGVDIVLESCGFACEQLGEHIEADLQRALNARSYDVAVSAGNVTDTYSYTLSSDDMPEIVTDDMRNHRIHQNNEHFRTSIRNLTKALYFFPTTGLYNFECKLNDSSPDYKCDFGKSSDVRSRQNLGVHLHQLGRGRDEAMTRKRFMSVDIAIGKGQEKAELFRNATCSDAYFQDNQKVLVSVPLRNPANNLEIERTLLMGKCQPRCLVTLPRKAMCSNLKADIDYDVQLTFWMYLCIRVFIGVIGGTAFAMFEGAVIALLREHNADYGLQRIYATIGGMISSPLSGMLIDYASRGKGYTDFRPAFYLYAFLKIASALLMLTINLEFKVPATNVVHDVLDVLKNVEILSLFVAIFVLGTAWGYLESFLFWLLQDLGASRSLMGITITVGGVAGIPLLVMSGPIISRIGHANVLFIGFIFYAIRLTGYSLIYDPWLCLIFEAMESVTSSLSFTAAVTYAAKLSTTTTDTSIQGLLGGLYYGVGKGAGSLVGGYLMKGFGTRPTYRIFAVMCLVVGFIYFLLNKFYLQKRPGQVGNDIVKKKPKHVIHDMVEIDLPDEKLTKETMPINQSANRKYGHSEYDSKSAYEVKPKSAEGANETADGKSCNVNLGFVVDDCDNESDDRGKEDVIKKKGDGAD